VAETIFPETLVSLPRSESKPKASAAGRAEVDHPTGTMDLPTGLHKEMGFDLVEIVTQGDAAAGSGSNSRSGVSGDAGSGGTLGVGSATVSRRANVTREASGSAGIVMATLEVS